MGTPFDLRVNWETCKFRKKMKIYERSDMETIIDDVFLTFNIENQNFAIEINRIKEIVILNKIRELSGLSNVIKGIIKFKKNIIPVIDVRKIMKIQKNETGTRICIVILELDSILTGLVVDKINAVLCIPKRQMEKPCKKAGICRNLFIDKTAKVGGDLSNILNIKKIFNILKIDQARFSNFFSYEKIYAKV